MKTNPTAEELLARMREILVEENLLATGEQPDPGTLIEQYVLPSLSASKNVLADLYANVHGGRGPLRMLKQLVVRRVANITRNTVEKSIMRQQKYNEMTYTLLRYLYEQQKEKHNKP